VAIARPPTQLSEDIDKGPVPFGIGRHDVAGASKGLKLLLRHPARLALLISSQLPPGNQASRPVKNGIGGLGKGRSLVCEANHNIVEVAVQTKPDEWLITAARERVGAFTDQLRTADDGNAEVPNLEWTVADLGQHIACLPSLWNSLHEGGDVFDPPARWANFSDQARAHITNTDPGALADLIDEEFDAYIDMLAAGDEPRWVYGLEMPRPEALALIINETVMHGLDLAAVTGATKPSYTDREAHLGAAATMLLTPVFIDPDKVLRQPDDVYHVKFRGGKDYTWTKSGATLTITEGKPAKAAAHLNSDAAMFLLSSLDRVGQVRAALSGKMVTYGWKPWRFLGLGTVAADGV